MSGGFEPWHTASGGSSSGVTGFATIGSSPAAAGASVSGSTATLQPADATHGGVIAASGAQTLAPALTLSGGAAIPANQTFTWGTSNLGRLSNTGIPHITLEGGSTQLYFKDGGDQVQFASGTSFALGFLDPGVYYVKFDSRTGVKSTNFLTNVGFVFPATLAPAGTTQTVDWTSGCSQTIDAASTTGTLVLTFSNPTNGGRYILKTLGKTGRVWTMPTSLWAGGVKPTVTAVDGAIDVFQFIYDGTNYIGSIVAQNVS